MNHALAILAYLAATFVIQALSHFVVNADHYAAVPHVRAEAVFPLGLGAMLFQGAILSWLFSRRRVEERGPADALRFAWLAGAFLVSYIALAEPAKYRVPGILAWIGVESLAGFAQFTLYGILLGLVWRRSRGRVSPSSRRAPADESLR